MTYDLDVINLRWSVAKLSTPSTPSLQITYKLCTTYRDTSVLEMWRWSETTYRLQAGHSKTVSCDSTGRLTGCEVRTRIGQLSHVHVNIDPQSKNDQGAINEHNAKWAREPLTSCDPTHFHDQSMWHYPHKSMQHLRAPVQPRRQYTIVKIAKTIIRENVGRWLLQDVQRIQWRTCWLSKSVVDVSIHFLEQSW